MSDDDLERRLRRTYMAVAAATTIDEGAHDGSTDCVEAGRRRPALRPWLAAAAVAAVVVAGLVVLAERDGTAPADDGRDLNHVLPGVVPAVSLTEGERRIPLVGIVHQADRDELTWVSSLGHSMRLEVRRDAGPLEDATHQMDRRAGQPARRVESLRGVLVEWDERPGLRISVDGGGLVDLDAVDHFIAGLILVDDQRWSRAIDRAGFVGTDAVVQRFEAGNIAIELRGNVHEGFDVVSGFEGGTSFLPLPLDGCRVMLDWDSTERADGDPDTLVRVGYLIITPDPRTSVEITADGRVHRVDLTPLSPAVQLSFGSIQLDGNISDPLPTCVEEAS